MNEVFFTNVATFPHFVTSLVENPCGLPLKLGSPLIYQSEYHVLSKQNSYLQGNEANS